MQNQYANSLHTERSRGADRAQHFEQAFELATDPLYKARRMLLFSRPLLFAQLRPSKRRIDKPARGTGLLAKRLHEQIAHVWTSGRV